MFLLFSIAVFSTLFFWSDQSLKYVIVTEADDTLLLLVWRLGVLMHRSFSGSVVSH